MKNQERVWKAEQAAAEEKKRILELQHERAAERDRTELNDLAKRSAGGSSANDDRLHWMYDKPDKKAQHEDYLLGKAIEKNYDQPEKSDDVIPAVARRVVGSSMLASGGDTQVDLARKMREDPLLLVKERERAARAALLNNPLHRKKLTELLRKEQEQKGSKLKKKSKKKDNDLDNKLSAKLNALGGEKGIDLAALLASEDSSSSSESSSEEERKKKKKKKKAEKTKKSKKLKKKKKQSHSEDSESSDDDKKLEQKSKDREKKSSMKKVKKSKKSKDTDSEDDRKSKHKLRDKDGRENFPDRPNRKRISENDVFDIDVLSKKSRKETSDSQRSRRRDSSEDRRDSRRTPERREKRREKSNDDGRWKARKGFSSEERAARLAAMAAAGAERELQRGRRVAQQRAADAAERPAHAAHRSEARALPDSLESRIHSNRHYIQRNSRHMNEHFARR
ncbi:pre-mRNA-splicing factor CWC25 homolog isoform X2 [Pectinophora gossypiella]|nr:pre-mRNA-splicing factor CWC25 homolog isoform X2 [Pectinophora gossypiella]